MITLAKFKDRIVSVDAALRGLACDCLCLECGSVLIAAKGDVLAHHFRHYSESNCAGAQETALHKFAKQVICEELKLRLPENCLGTMQSASSEPYLKFGIRPDVLAQFEHEPVAIEIWVAHQVPREKVEIYAQQQMAAIEIDLHYWRWADRSDEEWKIIILDHADRRWLYAPKLVREERQRQHQEELKRQQEERKRQTERLEWIAQQRRLEQEMLEARQEEERRRAEQRAEERERQREWQARIDEERVGAERRQQHTFALAMLERQESRKAQFEQYRLGLMACADTERHLAEWNRRATVYEVKVEEPS